MRVLLAEGDITAQPVDVVVNAARLVRFGRSTYQVAAGVAHAY